MKVTVKTNCLSKNLNQKIEITFSSRPNDNVLSELQKNGWWWMKNKGCWSHYYSDRNVNFAMELANRLNKQNINVVKTRHFAKAKTYKEDDSFAYLRNKTPMRKKHDYGVARSGANMTSVYDIKTRLVRQVC